MTDILDSITGAIGAAARPLKPIADFVLPEVEQQHDLSSIGGLFDTLQAGVTSAVREGPLAIVQAGHTALFGEGATTRDRLLAGGLALVGGTMAARQVHQAWKQSYTPSPIRQAPSGYRELIQYGDGPRWGVEEDMALKLLRERPGLPRRTLQILSTSDPQQVALGFGRWAPNDTVRTAAGSTLFQEYSKRVPELMDGAQVDWARFNAAMDKKLFKYEGNKEIRDLWTLATTDPQKLLDDPEATEKLFSVMKDFGDQTRSVVDDDLGVGLVGRISRVDSVDGRAYVYVRHPTDWANSRFDQMPAVVDPEVRVARLRELNYRAIAPQGAENLTHLFRKGMQSMSDEGTIFSRRLELGPEWYPTAFRDVAREFGIDPDIDPAAMDRAVAAVSFLSEAEDWSTNIVKARKTFELIGDVSDDDFQAWLRDGITVDNRVPNGSKHQYAGNQQKAHAKRLEQIHDVIKKNGLKADEKTLKKILRLVGGVESVEDVFRTNLGRKQRNFYLNIRHPDLEYPVTIDRHAFDAFIGLDSGIQDRPIDLSLVDDAQVYDVIADTYRKVAEDLSEELGIPLLPHQVQAVIWEGWRQFKEEHGKNGWSRNDPVKLDLNGNPNPVFEALHGRGDAFPSALDTNMQLDAHVLEAVDVEGLQSVTTPTGEVITLVDATESAALGRPALHPAIEGADRVSRWAPSRPVPFRDLATYLSRNSVDSSDVSIMLHPDLIKNGGHPGLRGEPSITMVVPDGTTVKLNSSDGKVTDLGRQHHETPDLIYDRIGVDDLDPDTFVGPDSPLRTHAWAALTAELNPDQVAARPGAIGPHNVKGGASSGPYSKQRAMNQLYADLVERGYQPIKAKGVWEGGSEDSFLVFGITPEEAMELGEKYGQDAVATNAGFIKNRQYEDGTLTAMEGQSFDPDVVAAADGATEVVIGGQTLRYTMTDFAGSGIDVNASTLVERTARTERVVQIHPAPGVDIRELAERLELQGKDLTIYANGNDIGPGWEMAYETYGSDGTQLVATRHRNGSVGAINGRHIFVRHASRYPEATELVGDGTIVDLGDGNLMLGDVLQVNAQFPSGAATISGPFEAKLDGQTTHRFGWRDGSITPIFDDAESVAYPLTFFASFDGKGRPTVSIEFAEPGDVAPAIQARLELITAGWDANKFEVKVGGKTYPMVDAMQPEQLQQMSTTMAGNVAGRIRTVKPDQKFVDEFGFPADFSWRQSGRPVSIPQPLQDGAYEVTAKIFDQHADAIRRFGFGGIHVADLTDNSAYAYVEWQGGGRMVLPAAWWADEELLTNTLRMERVERLMSPRLDADPRGIIVHEYGHVLHGAIRLEERMVQNSAFNKEVKDLVKRTTGKRNWSKAAKEEMGQLAGLNVDELVAESVAEVLWSEHPSRLALNVYDLLSDRLDGALKFRKAVNF